MREICAELATVLEAAGLELARPPIPGANLFTAPMPEANGGVPDRAVALVVTGGAEPLPYVGGPGTARLVMSCQVRVRSMREDFEGGQVLAHAVFTTLHQAKLLSCPMVRMEESAPIYLGVDAVDRHRWVIAIRVGLMSG